MAEVRLVDLEVIKRFSLAVRQDTASADEVLAALDASRSVVLAALGRSEPAPTPRPKPAAKRPPTTQPKPAAKRPPTTQPKPAAKAVTTRRRSGRAGSE